MRTFWSWARKASTHAWVTAVLAACALWLESAAAAPNVILIVIDDLGWADLGCMGSTFHRTPQLDRLASQGMRFTEAYAACPVCSPTRAALLTGKYPARVHLTDWLPGRPDRPDQRLKRPAFRQELPLEEVTLAEMLHSVGYATATIGKWHLGGAGFEPTRQGFDLNVAGDQAGSPVSYFAPYQRRDRSMPGLDDAPSGEYLTDRLTTEAEKFIEAHRQTPFFLYLPHYGVHTPLMAKPEMVAEYRGRRPHGLQANPTYAAMLESVDQSVGRLMQKLDELRLAENTVICFTSDNGGLATTEGDKTPATHNAPLREGKGYLYEGGIRVPLLIKWPGVIEPGSTCAAPVSSIDLLPTVAAMCGAAVGAEVDGESLVPLLRGSGELVRDTLYWHYPHYSNQGGRPGGAIRRGNHKLIEYYDTGRRELFDVVQDVSESRNLADEQPELTRELAAALGAWRSAVGAQVMTPNPDYLPNPPGSDGVIVLHASTAEVHGRQLRYEPLPHKRTLGFWTRVEDTASWEFTLHEPGKFRCLVLQGCGPGSGGSEVEIRVGESAATMTVAATRGFQDFVEREIGTLEIAQAGRHTLTVQPRTKPGPAVMDLRQIKLVPLGKS